MVQHHNDDDDSDHNAAFASGNVHLITTKENWEEKLAEASKDGKIVIANFSATWCGPCKMIAPFYCELSEAHPSLMFLTVDVDELSVTTWLSAESHYLGQCPMDVNGLIRPATHSSSWDIKATPTFFFLRDGQQVDKLVGANKPELQKKITAILDSMTQCNK
ncbi:Thioredoxin H9 [Vitis vinifera]|uniref:Thioredoxin H9 n=1 Tax=Vitis vinifera TaxID=29760 RepID=A0A438DZK7_VITVI|nr:Thioredoxin H9 [Vitis vinifera]